MKYKNAICIYHLQDNVNIICGITSKNPKYCNNCKENQLNGQCTLLIESNNYKELSIKFKKYESNLEFNNRNMYVIHNDNGIYVQF